jgi:hypothetical protein
MHIHWLAPQHFENIHALYITPLASLRLRAGALLSALPKDALLTAGPRIPAQAQVCVIGKIGVGDLTQRQAQWLGEIQAFQGKVVLDFTDDHISFPSSMSAFYLQALHHTDGAVCASTLLKERLAEVYPGPAHVIADAIECPIIKPKVKPDPLQALWFGHTTNLPALIDFLPSIVKPLKLHILTNAIGVQQIKSFQTSKHLQLAADLWSPQAMVKTALQCHMCIIPVRVDNLKKAGVSSNRLLTALALGLPTCADKVDSYLPFKDSFGDLRSPEFQEMQVAPELWHERVEKTQDQVLPRYAFQALGKQWLDLMQFIAP